MFRRGVPHDVAVRIAATGLDLSALQQMDLGGMADLGIELSAAEWILDKDRSPVAYDVATRLMHDCRRICCVCRNSATSLVLLDTGSAPESASTEESLVVICVGCRLQVRAEGGAGLNGEQLRQFRKRWEAESQSLAVKGFFAGPRAWQAAGFPPFWEYLNLRAISLAAGKLCIDPHSIPTFAEIEGRTPINEVGALDWGAVTAGKHESAFLYEGVSYSERLSLYFGELLEQVVSRGHIVDLSRVWSPPGVKAAVKSGDVGILTAAFRSKRESASDVGMGQTRSGYHEKDGVRLEFRFDAWEALTHSARDRLRGSWSGTVVCRIKTAPTYGPTTTIVATCLGIGTGFGSLTLPNQGNPTSVLSTEAASQSPSTAATVNNATSATLMGGTELANLTTATVRDADARDDADRRHLVANYQEEALRQTGVRLKKKDIWKYAGYKSRTEFERWQRNDPKTTKTACARFGKIFSEKPHLK